jgi:hypothetical protein
MAVVFSGLLFKVFGGRLKTVFCEADLFSDDLLSFMD